MYPAAALMASPVASHTCTLVLKFGIDIMPLKKSIKKPRNECVVFYLIRSEN
jgi:hypothetical protein